MIIQRLLRLAFLALGLSALAAPAAMAGRITVQRIVYSTQPNEFNQNLLGYRQTISNQCDGKETCEFNPVGIPNPYPGQKTHFRIQYSCGDLQPPKFASTPPGTSHNYNLRLNCRDQFRIKTTASGVNYGALDQMMIPGYYTNTAGGQSIRNSVAIQSRDGTPEAASTVAREQIEAQAMQAFQYHPVMQIPGAQGAVGDALAQLDHVPGISQALGGVSKVMCLFGGCPSPPPIKYYLPKLAWVGDGRTMLEYDMTGLCHIRNSDTLNLMTQNAQVLPTHRPDAPDFTLPHCKVPDGLYRFSDDSTVYHLRSRVTWPDSMVIRPDTQMWYGLTFGGTYCTTTSGNYEDGLYGALRKSKPGNVVNVVSRSINIAEGREFMGNCNGYVDEDQFPLLLVNRNTSDMDVIRHVLWNVGERTRGEVMGMSDNDLRNTAIYLLQYKAMGIVSYWQSQSNEVIADSLALVYLLIAQDRKNGYMYPDDLRNTTISWLSGQRWHGYSVPQLQGMKNRELYELAQRHFSRYWNG